ncbi:unnamed protein product [Moneuplotes crassus]|uniref:Uncharacterized protein n=1 Tax=Euplotes crassus TaxID=5936 RepID=A0AAD1XP37_EUPCR|nr:unnamed protein product [Moneuplotes crassus]
MESFPDQSFSRTFLPSLSRHPTLHLSSTSIAPEAISASPKKAKSQNIHLEYYSSHTAVVLDKTCEIKIENCKKRKMEIFRFGVYKRREFLSELCFIPGSSGKNLYRLAPLRLSPIKVRDGSRIWRGVQLIAKIASAEMEEIRFDRFYFCKRAFKRIVLTSTNRIKNVYFGNCCMEIQSCKAPTRPSKTRKIEFNNLTLKMLNPSAQPPTTTISSPTTPINDKTQQFCLLLKILLDSSLESSLSKIVLNNCGVRASLLRKEVPRSGITKFITISQVEMVAWEEDWISEMHKIAIKVNMFVED